jgi:hypothetical protein
MPPVKNPFDLYKQLPRTNCGDCGRASCLAFAAAVLKEEKRLEDCAHLDRSVARSIAPVISRQADLESIRAEQLKELKKEIERTDVVSRAAHLGAAASAGSIVIACLGKDFEVDRSGNVLSQCHTHAWFSLPLLDYILHSRGESPSGRWVPFRELAQGKTWSRLFERRCEQPLKRIADTHSDLFADLIGMFAGASCPEVFGSDISVILNPLPLVPVLICYWKPDEDIASKLHLFFDDTAERNLSIESLFTLGTGMVRMFEKIMYRHTDGRSELD